MLDGRLQARATARVAGILILVTGIELQFPPRLKALVQSRKSWMVLTIPALVLRLPAFPHSEPASHCNKDEPPRTQMESCCLKLFNIPLPAKEIPIYLAWAFDAFHCLTLVYFSSHLCLLLPAPKDPSVQSLKPYHSPQSHECFALPCLCMLP